MSPVAAPATTVAAWGTSRHCIGDHPRLAFEVSFGCIPRDDEPGNEIAGVGGIESGGDLDWAKRRRNPTPLQPVSS
jgi:hypothetical protein